MLHDVTAVDCIPEPVPSNSSVGDDAARPKDGEADSKLILNVYLLFAVSVTTAEARQLVPTVYVPVAVTWVVTRLDTWVQLAVILPCPSNCSMPDTSRVLATDAPESPLPVPLNSCAPVMVVGQVAGWELPVPLYAKAESDPTTAKALAVVAGGVCE